ncbi:Cof-type HAD-IIB family hydrolase [Rarobacter faecitabidus]|uniref:Uncharacterized protein n=1 Tax=Rarobacter faecitabidus TaxID=13243 RepID=A0A542ZP52_RARFA|nr:HAD family hydrolase [Rarobacter faecitabidus]TQL62151.1 hypothetical protein FB461_1789 [Rarobacter faecitabidus]
MPSSFSLRLFASDVDGTLLTFDHHITDEVRAAIGEARAAGVHVILASARSPQAIAILQDDLGLRGEPLVGLQGAWVGEVPADGAPVAYAKHPLPVDAARTVYETCQRLATPLCWFAEDEWFYSFPAQVVDYEARVTGIAPAGELDVERALEKQGPLKIMVPFNPADPAVGSRVLADLPDGLLGQLTGEHYLEITTPSADKSHGVALIAERLGVDRAHIAAAGDGPNDIGMFSIAGRSFAMGNASPAVQEAASQVTGTNAESGLALAIREALRA